MTAAGLRAALRDAQADGGPIYAGYSAGACVAGPDLAGIELMDDPELRPMGSPIAPADALGLTERRIIPHWRSDHPNSGSASRAVAELDRRGLPYVALRDGADVLVP